MSNYTKGVDVSKWNGDVDFEMLKSRGFNFVIIKAGGADSGLYRDSKFEENYKQARLAGMHIGAYWFSRALSDSEAIEEANYFLNLLKGKKFDFPVYIDVENRSMLSMGKRSVTDAIIAFCKTMESAGYWVGVYSSLNYFRTAMFDDELQDYAHWVAQWSTKLNYSKSSCGMWQYGGETNFIQSPYIGGKVFDQNYMLVDYPSIIAAKGFNGYSEMKSIDDIAYEVLDDVWGRGDERANRIESAGYDYSEVQSRVNYFYKIANDICHGVYGDGEIRRGNVRNLGLDPDKIQRIVNEIMYAKQT